MENKTDNIAKVSLSSLYGKTVNSEPSLNLDVPIIGEGWLNITNIRPAESGYYLIAKRVKDRWFVALAYYDKYIEHFLEEMESFNAPLFDVQFWHFLPDLPEHEDEV